MRHLAGALRELGHQVEYVTVARLVRSLGYSLQANVKTREGRQHPDRDLVPRPGAPPCDYFMTALLLLDLDNTLADREGAFLAWARVKAREWAPTEPNVVACLVEQDDDGMCPRHEFFSAVGERFGLQYPVDRLVADYRRELLQAFPAVPDDVIARLRELRADGWRIAVVTNGDATVQRAKLDHLGLLPLLDACCISGELGIRKPDPRIFELAASRCDEDLDEAWMVGDGEADILGASCAGIRSIWLQRGRTWPHSDVKPDHTANSILDALALLGDPPV